MSYTQANLDSIEAAILKPGTGTLVVEVSVAVQRLRYEATDVEKLQALKYAVQADLGTAPPLRTYAKQGGRCS